MDNRHFFNVFARGYDLLTRHRFWRDQIACTLEFADHPKRLRRVLDLGCGPGISSFVLAERLPDATVVGVDLSDRMIERARRHHRQRYPHLQNLEFCRADVYELPFCARHFDYAVGHSLLYLLPEPESALRAICEVLKAGGRLVLMEPNAEGSLAGAARRSTPAKAVCAPWAATRFATSMLLWRLVSRIRGQMTSRQLRQFFCDAGFDDVDMRPTLGRLGIHATGRRRR